VFCAQRWNENGIPVLIFVAIPALGDSLEAQMGISWGKIHCSL